LAAGLAKQHSRIDSVSEAARGAIRFSATVRARARNKPLLIGTRRFERTAQTSANGVLLFTLMYVARALRSGSRSSQTSRIISECNRLSRRFPQLTFSSRHVPSTLRRSIRSLAPNAVRPDYARSLRLADALLSGAGFEVSPLPGGIESQCFMLSLDLIFEDYVRSILRAGLAGFHVRDAKKFPPHGARRLLLTNGTAKSEAEPDVVIQARDDRPLLVVDAKYKNPQRSIERADLNQVIAYGAAYGVSAVGLVTPSAGRGDGVTFLGEAGGLKLLNVPFDLSTPDRSAAENQFVNSINGILTAPPRVS
jgi:5-methylcytosine-specific restriction endonuclease McrBC regulatory subunit McrC